MITDIILFIVGAVLVIFGADVLVDGASGIAKKFGMSEFVIGATIVAIGTSLPELVVSCISALNGSADMAIGNVTGSNLFNTMLILGITSLIAPICYTKRNILTDLPVNLIVALLFLVLACDSIVGKQPVFGRIDGILLLLCFVVYIVMTFRGGNADDFGNKEDSDGKSGKTIVYLLMCAAGIAGLVFGGDLFVDSAIKIATKLGVSQTIIAMTLMAGGTSLPELAACVAAARKGQNQLALGNIIGSNISNILLIIGTGAVIIPLQVNRVGMSSIIAVVASAVILLSFALISKKKQLSRLHGITFIAIYIVYMAIAACI